MRRIAFALVVIVISVSTMVWFGVGKPQNSSDATPMLIQALPAESGASPISTIRKPSVDKAPRLSGFEVVSTTPAEALRSLAFSSDMVELLRTARRSSDVTAQEFAIDAPVVLCFSLVISRNAGFTPLVESRRAKLASVLNILQPTTSAAFAETASACQNYAQEGQLRDELAKEFMAKGAPVASAKRALGATYANEEAKTQSQLSALQRILANDPSGAVGVFLLKAPLASVMTPSVLPDLPEWLREDAVQVAMTGIELGVCRSGLPCGQGSIARASLCAKYGECGSPDVETAIRNLHALYGIPFEYADHVADRVARAIQSRNASTLLAGN